MASRIMAIKGLNTAASFRGRLYVNVIVVPSTNADQFEKFCKLNKSCCPLLQRSAPGDTTTKPLVRDSDIRYGQMLWLNFRILRNSFPPHLHVSGGFEDRGITQ